MANDVTISPGAGGPKVSTTDISSFTAYSSAGEVASGCLYVSQGAAIAPSPALPTNPLPTAAACVGDAIWIGGVACSIQFARVAASASGATNLVAATGGRKIRVVGFTLSASAAVNAKFANHSAGTDLTGLLYMGATGGIGGGFKQVGHFETAVGDGLDLNLSAAVPVGGMLQYILV
jgi:hypothetical protein